MSDAEAIFVYASDLEVVRYMDWPRATGIADSVQAAQRALTSWDAGDEYSWRLTVPPDDTAIGSIGCRFDGSTAEFGFVLGRHYWGHGYATEAAGAIVAWLKSLDFTRRIQATCDVDNTASARVLVKLGLTREAVLAGHIVRPNMPGAPRRDALIFAWTRPA